MTTNARTCSTFKRAAPRGTALVTAARAARQAIDGGSPCQPALQLPHLHRHTYRLSLFLGLELLLPAAAMHTIGASSFPPLFLSVHLFNVGFSGSSSASNIIDWCLLVKLISVQASIWKGVKEPQLQKFLFSVALFINLPVLLLQWLLRDGHSITINFIGPGICLAAHCVDRLLDRSFKV
jgi:hypothetical protein